MSKQLMVEGRIQARKLVEENTLTILFSLSDKHLEAEKESGTFWIDGVLTHGILLKTKEVGTFCD